MAQYRCSKCGAIFEGVPSTCPACGAILSNSQPMNAQATFVNPENDHLLVKKANTRSLLSFIFGILALLLAGASVGIIFLARFMKLSPQLVVIIGPIIAITSWVFAVISRTRFFNAAESTGGFSALKVFGFIFGSIGLLLAVILTFAWILITSAYFISDWLSNFISIDLKQFISEYITTGKINW